jgi:hypothetical protein
MLAVLFIIMMVVVVSLGILYRSDMALAGGHNYALRTQADYIAWAGLEHARALILADQVPENPIQTPLFSLDNDNNHDAKDDFIYQLSITKTSDPNSIPNAFSVESKVYYQKNKDASVSEGRVAPGSKLTATVLYDPNVLAPKAWFTNIQHSQ